MYTLLSLKWITNKELLYTVHGTLQGHVTAWTQGRSGGEEVFFKGLEFPFGKRKTSGGG